jgi:hypothetical protein
LLHKLIRKVEADRGLKRQTEYLEMRMNRLDAKVDRNATISGSVTGPHTITVEEMPQTGHY